MGLIAAKAAAEERRARCMRTLLRVYGASETTVEEHTRDMTQRRMKATSQWIEDTIATGQRRGLTTSSVSHYPDGSIEVNFSGAPSVTTKAKSWDI